jgi:hypothetical protein
MARRKRATRTEGGDEQFIDWDQPDRNLHVLDWRERAHQFGLTPIDDEEDEPSSAVALAGQTPQRLIEEEEDEAFDRQRIDADDEDAEQELEEPPEAGVSSEDLDLVRVYLKHIGRRKLLKASEEQEIGRRIEAARQDVQAALATVPCAVDALIRLADHVKRGSAPARTCSPCSRRSHASAARGSG